MSLPPVSQVLRIYIGEADRHHGKPLYEALVYKARELGLGGATVFRSPLGFGSTSHLRSAKMIELSSDLPLVIEIIESPEKIQEFLPIMDSMLNGGLATLHSVDVVHYSVKKD